MLKQSMTSLTILFMVWFAITLVSSTPEMCKYDMSYLGTVEGKSYFFEKIATNWTTSKQRCEGAGMHLATVTTLAQLTLLKLHDNVTGSSYYWTGARDSQTSTQFVWDYNNVSLNSSLFTDYTPSNGIQTCVAYRGNSSSVATFHFYSCERVRCYSLCEIIHNRNF